MDCAKDEYESLRENEGRRLLAWKYTEINRDLYSILSELLAGACQPRVENFRWRVQSSGFRIVANVSLTASRSPSLSLPAGPDCICLRIHIMGEPGGLTDGPPMMWMAGLGEFLSLRAFVPNKMIRVRRGGEDRWIRSCRQRIIHQSKNDTEANAISYHDGRHRQAHR